MVDGWRQCGKVATAGMSVFCSDTCRLFSLTQGRTTLTPIIDVFRLRRRYLVVY